MNLDLSDLMRDPRLLPPEKRSLLSGIADRSAALGFPCYLVGGFVRDLLLRRPVNDLDIIVEGDAIQLGRMLLKEFGGTLTPYAPFYTAIWQPPASDETIDLITARSESYSAPGALPTVRPSSIEDDLRRRDFTINALAVRADGEHLGEVLDPLHGRDDLQRGIIRALHPRSFIDDPTRILRAIRYEGRYGFQIESGTLNWIDAESLTVLSTLSGERLRHELDLILAEENAASMLARADEVGVLKAIHPSLPRFDSNRANWLDEIPNPALNISCDRETLGYLLWLLDVPAEDLATLSRRLDFTSELSEALLGASRLNAKLPALANSLPSAWTFALEMFPLLSVYAMCLVAREPALLEYLPTWRHIKPHTNGDTLLALGLPPGPQYKEILTHLRAAWLDGEVSNEDEEKKLLESLLNNTEG
ncbi:MAG: CCA tRNA nucleotidyltransferase [Chloroflexi bacterium]|nr:CCA tRNA nucleotidyltransferase [Chloroflexota bacterium]